MKRTWIIALVLASFILGMVAGRFLTGEWKPVGDGSSIMHTRTGEVRPAVVPITKTTKPKTPRDPYQHYPNIPGEVLIDNDHVVVQRFVVEPGAWEGIHSHPGKQIYIHVRGGEWTVRTGGKETVGTDADGSVGWMDAVDLSEQHESGNTGNTTIELIWVTLK